MQTVRNNLRWKGNTKKYRLKRVGWIVVDIKGLLYSGNVKWSRKNRPIGQQWKGLSIYDVQKRRVCLTDNDNSF